MQNLVKLGRTKQMKMLFPEAKTYDFILEEKFKNIQPAKVLYSGFHGTIWLKFNQLSLWNLTTKIALLQWVISLHVN